MQTQPDGFYKVATTDYYGEWQVPFCDVDKANLNSYCYTNYATWPDGEQLRTGQKIRVWWKDGNWTQEKLVVVHSYGSAQVDMNNSPDTFATQKLYVMRNVNGTKVRVPLIGLKIKRDKP